MYKLVIADDEPIIRKSIANYIEWKKFGFELVGVFSDGSEVIKFIKENEVDVILSDIIMSNMSGLEVARSIYEQKLPIKTILLSAYQDFEFAREGIKYHVFDYLLKPIAVDEITNKFMELKKILDEEKGQKAKESVRQEFVFNISSTFIKKLWTENNIKKEDLSVYAQAIGMNDKNRFIVFMCKSIIGSGQLAERLTSVHDKLEQEGFYSCYIGDGNALIMFAENKYDSKLLIKKAIQIISCEEIVVLYVKEKEYIRNDECKLSATVQNDLNNAIGEALAYLEKIDRGQCGDDAALESSFSLLSKNYMQAVLNVSVEVFLNILQISIVEQKKMLSILKSISFDEKNVSSYLKKLYDQFLKMHNAGIGTEYDFAIEKVKSYIKENISEDMSLDSLAALVNLNPAYFGRYFKKATLITVKQFIYETKMEEAIVLLSEKRHTVNEIAQMVGCDFKYFFLLFKKYTGYTPKEYFKYFIE